MGKFITIGLSCRHVYVWNGKSFVIVATRKELYKKKIDYYRDFVAKLRNLKPVIFNRYSQALFYYGLEEKELQEIGRGLDSLDVKNLGYIEWLLNHRKEEKDGASMGSTSKADGDD